MSCQLLALSLYEGVRVRLGVCVCVRCACGSVCERVWSVCFGLSFLCME